MQARVAKRFVGGRLLRVAIILAFVLGSTLSALVLAAVVDRSDATAPGEERVIPDPSDAARQSDIQDDTSAYQLPDGDVDSEFMRGIRGSESNPGQGEGLLDGQRQSATLIGPAIPADLMLFLEQNLYLPGDTGATMSHQELQQWEWEREQPVVPDSAPSRTDDDRQLHDALTDR